MQSPAFIRSTLGAKAFSIAFGALAACAGCSTPPPMSLDKLASIGVTEGTMYWDAEQKLAREGYQCFVADDANRVSHLKVAEPACIGTP